ncbi:MAG: DRTGG domain-containing protein [Bacillota bacterium]|nr:DRTGG domain-containing protein [Bacillota bacterium]
MTVRDVANALDCEVVTGGTGLEREVESGYVCDLLSYVISRAGKGAAWITMMSNINVVAVGLLADVSCIIITDGNELDTSSKAKADSEDVPVLLSKKTTFETAAGLAKILGV